MQPGKLAWVAGAAFAVALVAGGQNDERAFIKEAVQGDLAEVRLGELAAQRAQDEDVRRFGEMLRTDHRAALQRSTDLAKSMQVEPPSEPPTEARGFYDGLSQLSGSQFDAAFVSHMVTAHEATIAKYSRNASSNNAAIASLVADSLPKLKAHLEAARGLQRGEPVHLRH
jgi:putative membrane protein